LIIHNKNNYLLDYLVIAILKPENRGRKLPMTPGGLRSGKDRDNEYQDITKYTSHYNSAVCTCGINFTAKHTHEHKNLSRPNK